MKNLFSSDSHVIGLGALLCGAVILAQAFLFSHLSYAQEDVDGAVCEEGGSYKVDDWPDGWSEYQMTWEETWEAAKSDGCSYGVADAGITIKAGSLDNEGKPGYEGGPNECYGFEWDQDGWRVWEKWNTPEEKGECKDISHVEIYWECACEEASPSPTPEVSPSPSPEASPSPSPQASPSPSPRTSPSPSPEASPSPSPEALPSPSPESSPSPSPEASPSPQPEASPSPSPSSDGGTGGPSGEETSPTVEQKQGQVLGASTYAGTGIFDEEMAKVVQMLGIMIASVGAARYAKKRV